MSIEVNKHYFKGINFITPVVLEYFENSNIIIELARSKEKLLSTDKYGYGITVVDKNTKHMIHENSNLFYNEDKAREYIKVLLDEYKEE